MVFPALVVVGACVVTAAAIVVVFKPEFILGVEFVVLLKRKENQFDQFCRFILNPLKPNFSFT